MQDQARDRSSVLLEGILQTLKQINEHIVVQEQRWDRFAEVLGSSSTPPSGSFEKQTNCTGLSSFENPNDEREFVRRKSPATFGSLILPSIGAPDQKSKVPPSSNSRAGRGRTSLVNYRSWRSPLEASPLKQYSFLTEELGDAWTIPDDGRIPLSFSREVLEGLSSDQLRAAVSYISKFGQKMARSSDLRFHVIDYDGVGGNIVYRLGQPLARGMQELKPIPKSNPTVDAPWRRFM
jgi:hypothetical protein